jgi:hypothetical protein
VDPYSYSPLLLDFWKFDIKGIKSIFHVKKGCENTNKKSELMNKSVNNNAKTPPILIGPPYQ